MPRTGAATRIDNGGAEERLTFHRTEEFKRLFGIDPADDPVVDALADTVIHLPLGPANEETTP